MIFNTKFKLNLCGTILRLSTLVALASTKETDTLKKLTFNSAGSLLLQDGIVNLDALRELEENITGYTVPANYGSASFNQVRPLYPGAVAL